MNDRVYTISSKRVHPYKIEQDRLFNVFVFGLPRSGTSMTTHICELLGVKMIHTSDETTRDYAHLGEDYHPNPHGFFEITKDLMKNYMKIAGTPYSGCKMIIPVQGMRLSFVKELPSKVIMTWRDPEEIKQSQEAFYSRASNKALLRTQLAEQKVTLQKAKIDFMIVRYEDVVNNPEEEIQKIKEFINSDADISKAVESVKPSSHRFNNKDITVGV
jgi:hypothetical protein